jgi:arylsulfatase A-like enzyme
VSQVDLLASFATFTGRALAASDAPDSYDVMPALLGESKKGRSVLVEQGGSLALRQERWKYIEPSNRPRFNKQTNTELGNDTAAQLYDLNADPGETTNVADRHPARLKELEELLRKIRQAGRSTLQGPATGR